MASGMEAEAARRNSMNGHPTKSALCALCGQTFPPDELVPAEVIRPRLARLIRHEHPAWQDTDCICLGDLNRFRMDYVRQVIEAEVGDLSVLEEDVVKSLKEHELVASDVEKEFETRRRMGERFSDVLAAFGGSWTFIGVFALLMAAWILWNTLATAKPPDPYPFILLNLLLSGLAALQAPVIMMSQKRQEARDRLRADSDYKVNLKAELEIRHLHEKLDHLLRKQSQRLFEIQQIQLDLMRDLAGVLPRSNHAPAPQNPTPAHPK